MHMKVKWVLIRFRCTETMWNITIVGVSFRCSILISLIELNNMVSIYYFQLSTKLFRSLDETYRFWWFIAHMCFYIFNSVACLNNKQTKKIWKYSTNEFSIVYLLSFYWMIKIVFHCNLWNEIKKNSNDVIWLIFSYRNTK